MEVNEAAIGAARTQPGGILFAVDFEVLTTPRPYPMTAGGGAITLSSGSGNALDEASFTASFRSTSGSLRNSRPYVQDTTAAASITADPASLTLTRQADGTFAGQLSTSVRYAGDAAHDDLRIEAVGLPAGVRLSGTFPASPCFFSSCTVPGGRFMAGERHFVDLLFTADPTTSVGDLGTVQLTVTTHYGASAVTDADPSDNTVSVAVSAAETL
ncbi:hypothetical protein AB0J86_24900 [Micromonospora sp. NPDC049559]|uniref:hypothetical protein n=1 Tax=Micromonospora sp. NPDC049559 TaxID=3155923 RepID=UPI00341B14A1